jgi:hypothetical protein
MMSGEPHFQLGKFFVAGGIALAILGLIMMAGQKFSLPTLGRLPGDIALKNKHFQFYFPIVSCVILSVVFTVVLWIVSILARK